MGEREEVVEVEEFVCAGGDYNVPRLGDALLKIWLLEDDGVVPALAQALGERQHRDVRPAPVRERVLVYADFHVP